MKTIYEAPGVKVMEIRIQGILNASQTGTAPGMSVDNSWGSWEDE